MTNDHNYTHLHSALPNVHSVNGKFYKGASTLSKKKQIIELLATNYRLSAALTPSSLFHECDDSFSTLRVIALITAHFNIPESVSTSFVVLGVVLILSTVF